MIDTELTGAIAKNLALANGPEMLDMLRSLANHQRSETAVLAVRTLGMLGEYDKLFGENRVLNRKNMSNHSALRRCRTFWKKAFENSTLLVSGRIWRLLLSDYLLPRSFFPTVGFATKSVARSRFLGKAFYSFTSPKSLSVPNAVWAPIQKTPFWIGNRVIVKCCVLRIVELGGDLLYSVDKYHSFEKRNDVQMAIEATLRRCRTFWKNAFENSAI